VLSIRRTLQRWEPEFTMLGMASVLAEKQRQMLNQWDPAVGSSLSRRHGQTEPGRVVDLILQPWRSWVRPAMSQQ